ncbi:hypothetical protein VTJ04DRAFT_624 [Mycothermus thermophilus]
MPPASAQN